MKKKTTYKDVLVWPIKIILYPIAFVLISIYEFLKWYFKLLEKGINWIADQLIRIINKIIIILEVIGRFLKRIFRTFYTYIKYMFTRLISILEPLLTPFYRIIDFIGRWIYRVLSWIFKYIGIFVRWIGNILHKLFSPVYRFIKNVVLSVRKIIRFILDYLWKVVKWIWRLLKKIFYPVYFIIKTTFLMARKVVFWLGNLIKQISIFLYEKVFRYPWLLIKIITVSIYNIGRKIYGKIRSIFHKKPN
jgi:phage-related protein